MTKPANGKVPASALVLVQTGTYKGLPYSIYLETATAAAFFEAQTADKLYIAPPLGGNRSLTDQEHLHDEPGQYGSSLPSSKIAAPGLSTHGWGDCVDIAAGNTWFQIHCGAYGFVRESPAGESNHYRYLHPTWASTITAGTGTTTPITDPTGGQEMALNMVHVPKGAPDKKSTLYCLFGPGFFRTFIANQETANGFARQVGGNSVEVSAAFLADLEVEAAKGYSVPGAASQAAVSVADLEAAFSAALAKLPKPPTKITGNLS